MPIAAVALLAILAFFLWRRNRDKKARLAARKGEIEDYGFDPNAGDGGAGPGPSSAAALGGAGAGIAGGTAAAAGLSNEMRQSPYGDDDGTGYRGWGPTSSNSKRPSWMPGSATEAAAAGAIGAGAGAYYGHQRGDSGGGYEPYSNRGPGDYYYPEEEEEQQGGVPPNIPPKSYERYDPGAAQGYVGAPATEYEEANTGALGVANADIQRHPSNASSRYSTVSTDENAGRSYQNSPRFPQSQSFPNPPAESAGRLGRSTMGTGAGYDDEDQGGRYDAVNF